MQTDILYGINPVFEALKTGRRDIYEVYIEEKKTSRRLEKITVLAKQLKIPLKKVTRTRLESMTGTNLHQGTGAKTSRYPLLGLSDLIEKIKTSYAQPFFLLLDNLSDPHNLGAIIRTALCAGVNGIIIPKHRSASPTPAVAKASAGALEHIDLVCATNMVNTIKILKEKGLWVVGMDQAADEIIYSSNLTGSIAVVIGGEEKGIRPLVKKNCDLLISIPQIGKFNSLNASTAGAVVMYEIFRQRASENS